MNKSKLITVVLASFLTLASLTACGSSQNASQNTSSGAANSKSKELVVYSTAGYTADVAKVFETKTGIKVKIVSDSAGNLLAKAQAERNNPQWDIMWIEGTGAMESLNKQGMLLTGWTPKNAGNYTDLGKSLLPKDKAYIPTGTSAAGVIAYNTKLVAPDQAPKEWKDLLDPKFKNSISMNDPNISGPAYPFIAGIFKELGTDNAHTFFNDLKKNGSKFFPSSGDATQAIVAGTVKIAVLQDTGALDLIDKGNPIALVYPKSGVSMATGAIGIRKNATNMDAAKQFADFILSKEAQDIMVKTKGGPSHYQPLIKDVQAKPGRQQDIKWNVEDPVWSSDHENEFKTWFHENIVQN